MSPKIRSLVEKAKELPNPTQVWDTGSPRGRLWCKDWMLIQWSSIWSGLGYSICEGLYWAANTGQQHLPSIFQSWGWKGVLLSMLAGGLCQMVIQLTRGKKGANSEERNGN